MLNCLKFTKLVFVSLLFSGFFLAGYAQKAVVVADEHDHYFPTHKKDKLPQEAKSSEKLKGYLPGFVRYYHSQGYALFSVDSLTESTDTIRVRVYKGAKYTESIGVKPDEELLVRQAGLAPYLQDGHLSISDYPLLSVKLIRYYENNGFPFTEVSLDSINMGPEGFRATLHIDQHHFTLFDSIVLGGNAKVRKSYLYPYLGLRRGKPYRESTVRKIPGRIAELPFVTEFRSSGIEFIEDKAYLYLFLNKVKTNQFDGYIGLVPVDESTGKTTLNGELNLNLKNVFGLGETMSVLWRSPEKFSQYLTLHVNFPYLLWTPFGLDGRFLLDKKDTSYLNVNYMVGIQYSFLGNNYVKTYFDFTTSQVLSPELLVITESNFSFFDYKKRMYGLEVAVRKLDYLYNPRKGFSFLLNAAAGKMNIIKNNRAEEDIYEGIEMSNTRYSISADVRGYVPLHARWVLVMGAYGGSLFGSQNVANELFKIGGMRSLRGFDENAIEASSYAMGLFELRFIFARKSYLHAFFNGGWYEKDIREGYLKAHPFGFGAGIAFDTRAGIFHVSYALGKQFDNPISFKTGKIHFGMALNF